jgi:hypothetical protein
MQDPTLTNGDNLSDIPLRGKNPGRHRREINHMGYGNISGKRQKGIYLSRVRCDMVEQLSILCGKTESAIHEDAITDLYMKVMRQYEDAKINWRQILEDHHYHLPRWQR